MLNGWATEFGVKYIMALYEARLRFWAVEELIVLGGHCCRWTIWTCQKPKKVAVLPGLEGKSPRCGGGS